MKVIILAGGFGTRLSEYTELIPKPMVTVGGHPILWHIMQSYAHFGHKEFYVALGYKAEVIKEYFLNYHSLNSDFTVDLKNGDIQYYKKNTNDWKVTLIDTGLNTMTGGRVKRLESFVGNQTFLLTYGDGVSDVKINDLLSFHKSHGKMVTITGVHPPARFGELNIDKDRIIAFKEKPSAQTKEGWINGGYMVAEPDFFDLIESDKTVMEKEPLERVAELGELMVFRHSGFWHCMDTKRDRDTLEDMWRLDQASWKYGDV